MKRLKELYPDAVFPDIYFLIGSLNTGGTTSRAGILIGAEIYGRTANAPISNLSPLLQSVLRPVEEIPGIVAHELIHCQQPIWPGRTLLARALYEGSADFVGNLISGYNINSQVHAWALPRERALWQEFRTQMHGTDMGTWFSVDTIGNRPKDLGYFVGYRIAESYYDKAVDKKAAIRDILRMQDPERFLEASHYASRFSTAHDSSVMLPEKAIAY